MVGTGSSDQNYGYSEIYHVKNQSVTIGPRMPFGPLHGASSTPFGDTFLVAGGSKPLEGDAESTGKVISSKLTAREILIQIFFTDILYFDPDTEQFQVVEQKMSIGRSNHLIFALEEFPSAVCSPFTTPGYPDTTSPDLQTTTGYPDTTSTDLQTTTTTTTVSASTTSFATTTSSGSDLPPQCFVAGECEGDLIGIFAGTVGADECLAACRNTTGCVWFTEYEVRLMN